MYVDSTKCAVNYLFSANAKMTNVLMPVPNTFLPKPVPHLSLDLNHVFAAISTLGEAAETIKSSLHVYFLKKPFYLGISNAEGTKG